MSHFLEVDSNDLFNELENDLKDLEEAVCGTATVPATVSAVTAASSLALETPPQISLSEIEIGQ